MLPAAPASSGAPDTTEGVGGIAQTSSRGWWPRERGLPRQGLAIPHGMALADLDRDSCLELITLHGGRDGHLTVWKPQACRALGRATSPVDTGEGERTWQ
jgi:hypothetical protein